MKKVRGTKKEIKGLIKFSPEASLNGDSLGTLLIFSGKIGYSEELRRFSRRPISIDDHVDLTGL